MGKVSCGEIVILENCFKSDKGRCIDLFLTIRKHNFIHSQTFETGIGDYHCMICTKLKTKFIKFPPKRIYTAAIRIIRKDLF